jgi:hypothetical protein
MSENTSQHPTLPIVMFNFDSSMSFSTFDPALLEPSTQLINAAPGNVYYLLDMSSHARLSVDEIMKAGALASRKGGNISSPKITETLIIVPDLLVELAVQGLRSERFGQLRVKAFRSVAEAEAYVAEQLQRKVS